MGWCWTNPGVVQRRPVVVAVLGHGWVGVVHRGAHTRRVLAHVSSVEARVLMGRCHVSLVLAVLVHGLVVVHLGQVGWRPRDSMLGDSALERVPSDPQKTCGFDDGTSMAQSVCTELTFSLSQI